MGDVKETLAPLSGLIWTWVAMGTGLVLVAIGMGLVRRKGLRLGLLTLGLLVFFVSVPTAVISRLATAPRKEKPSVPERPANVDVFTVKRGAFDDIILLPVVAESREDAYVKLSAEVAGRVVSAEKVAGDPVTAGDVIILIDREGLEALRSEAAASVVTAEASVVTAKASVTSAEATLAEVQARYGRVEGLFEQKVRSKQELDAVRAELDRAGAELARAQSEVGRTQAEEARAKATLKVADVALTKGTVKSPISGTLDRRYVDVGEFVSVGTPLAEVLDAERMYAVVQVPEMDRQYVKVGARTPVVFPKVTLGREVSRLELVATLAKHGAAARRVLGAMMPPDAELGGLSDDLLRQLPERLPFYDVNAKVKSAGEVGDVATRTYRAQIEFDNHNRRVKPGMIGLVIITRRQLEDVISVPIDSVVSTENERLVYVVEDGRATPRRLDLSEVTDGKRVLVLSGLKEGEQIVREPREVAANEVVSVQHVDGVHVEAAGAVDEKKGNEQTPEATP